jgi:putative FmdB family regulatory protein
MPIYEYDCQRCGTFEVSQRITEKPLGKCPSCRGKVKKLISNTSFQLKGTGWYITDYARKGANGDAKGGDAKGDNGSKSTSESKSSTESKSTESKNEAKKTDSSSTKSDKSSTSSSTST